MNKLFFLTFVLIAFFSRGQERLASWESQVALNYIVKQWSLSSSVSHRTTLLRSEGDNSKQFAFLEANQFVSRRIGSKLRISVGYKYRSLNPTDGINIVEQRLTEQVTMIHTYNRARLMSRVRFEQRFQNNADFRHRYRYRFSLDMPLNGLKLDSNEFYFLASNELLLELEKTSESFDNRISTGLGYMFSSFCKIQAELTYRMEDLSKRVEYIPFLNTSLIMNL